MKLTILGSGGFQTIPRPACKCKICTEARERGVPYSRNGPSIFIEGIDTLIDTPKDIINSVNRERITEIRNILFTHWHPDHTEGMRIVEELTCDWSGEEPFELRNQGVPITVSAPQGVLEEVKNIRSPSGSYLDHFESKGFIVTAPLEFGVVKRFGDISITPIKNNCSASLTSASYIIQEGDKKAVYMPCDVKPYDDLDFLEGADLFIVGSPFFESKSGLNRVPESHPLRAELFSFEEITAIIRKYNIKKTIIVHIEEMWGLSFDDFKVLEERYKDSNIFFAYDGLVLGI